MLLVFFQDVGFTDLDSKVINAYFHQHLPHAVRTELEEFRCRSVIIISAAVLLSLHRPQCSFRSTSESSLHMYVQLGQEAVPATSTEACHACAACKPTSPAGQAGTGLGSLTQQYTW